MAVSLKSDGDDNTYLVDASVMGRIAPSAGETEDASGSYVGGCCVAPLGLPHPVVRSRVA